MSDDTTFELGLCMAGAVSAGAYTAGVVDYLLETLDKWERAKQLAKKQPQKYAHIPTHDVKLSVLSGASAGGMTAIITSAAIQQKMQPISPDKQHDEGYKKTNTLYDAWVNLLTDEMFPIMLATDDLSEKKRARAFLNSDFIDKVAEKALTVDPTKLVEQPYIAKGLELLVTLSNIAGFPYRLNFRADGDETATYLSSAHNDYGHFSLCDDATCPGGRIPLSYKHNRNVDIAKDCAKATGAFPIGLAQRVVRRDRRYITENPLINRTIPHDLGLPEGIVETLNLDGGMINNEPFEYTRKLLLQRTGEKKKDNKHVNTFKSSVLMIDPFPSERGEAFDMKKAQYLDKALGNIIGTMRSQLLFKPDDVAAALNENDYSRFLIAPKRYEQDQPFLGSMAIACGAMDGFSGFISKAFRVHDFYLGRRNCQYFLRTVFAVPTHTENPVFKNGYATEAAKHHFTTASGMLPIIPDMDYVTGDLSKNQEPPPVWPHITEEKINSYKSAVKKRVQKVGANLVHDMNAFDKFLFWIGSKVFISRKLTSVMMKWMIKDLKKHHLLR